MNIQRKKSFFVILSFILVLFIVSCKSTPVEPAPVLEDETVETKNSDVKNEQVTQEIDKSLLDKVEESREQAKEAGADLLFNDLFAQADEALEQLKKQNSTDEKSLKNLGLFYDGLSILTEAKNKKDKIDSGLLESYDQKSYEEGCAAFSQAFEVKADNGEQLYNLAKLANDDFSAVLETAYRSLCKEERLAAFNAKKDADSVKAFVSRKAEYDEGVACFKKGDSEYVTKSLEAAYLSYKTSKETFIKLYSQIFEARQKAQKAVDAAKERVLQSEQTAKKADQDNPLDVEQAVGFEDSETQLLEDDDFTQQAASEVALAEEIEGEGDL